jgi:hypothetical protein
VRLLLAACLLAFWRSAALAGPADSTDTPTRPLNHQESSQLQDYTRTLSKDWLKELFDLDVDAIGISMQRRAEAATQFGGSGASVSGTASPGYAFSMHLEQVDDLRRLAYDPRDIPFALKLQADNFFGPLQTSALLPLSWKDELWAKASVPLPELGLPLISPLLNTAGFGSRWSLNSIYANRLGVNSVEAGLGTRWMGDWDFGLDSKVSFGQGERETSSWMKLGKTF